MESESASTILDHNRDKIRDLTHRISMAHDIGVAALGMPENVFETVEGVREYRKRLYEEQPDLWRDVSELEGKRNIILATSVPRHY